MKIIKEGIYRDKEGRELPVVNVSSTGEHGELIEPYFRVYWNGGYYNVNHEGDGPFEGVEWEMVEYVKPLDKV